MVKNTIFMTTVIFLGLAFLLLDQCQFLIPLRYLLLAKYGYDIAAFAVVLFINLFAALYVIGRKLFLKDTGQKLAHLEKEIRNGSGLSDELSRRLEELR